MVTTDWGRDTAPHPVPAGRAHRTELERDRLPEVRQLVEFGWTLVPDSTLWCFLPRLWPAPARTWVPDRSTVWVTETRTDATGRITDARCVPMGEEERRREEAEVNALLAEAGVPPRPPGRIWLLRPVGDHPGVEAMVEHVLALARPQGLDHLCPGLVDLWAAELRRASSAPGRRGGDGR
ncbi:DUF5956 family protein [Streptomyces sp. ST2-7A]|uniref:DUF5956 family protein n=1 Tax=Streptomyces sp. ST2-7A TaxID=2907214 RepID=UPI001F2AF4E8|nr:DUF5956 family protein [Streptomyces sp. ST2-7A]MCE7082642.1 DUF5956 family protein [Streptomyces sp. ST2-7A]